MFHQTDFCCYSYISQEVSVAVHYIWNYGARAWGYGQIINVAGRVAMVVRQSKWIWCYASVVDMRPWAVDSSCGQTVQYLLFFSSPSLSRLNNQSSQKRPCVAHLLCSTSLSLMDQRGPESRLTQCSRTNNVSNRRGIMWLVGDKDKDNVVSRR